MEKRGLISLRGVLLRYLVQTVFCCVLALLYLLRRGCVQRWRGRLEEIETH